MSRLPHPSLFGSPRRCGTRVGVHEPAGSVENGNPNLSRVREVEGEFDTARARISAHDNLIALAEEFRNRS